MSTTDNRLRGPAGPAGPPGPKGPRGFQGEVGPEGFVPGTFNPKNAAYGAVGDNVADDAPALQAALNDMDSDELAGVLLLPSGEFYCANDIHITRPAIVRGIQGGAGNSLTKIRFAPGKQFIAWHLGAPVSAGGVSGQGAALENLDIITSPVTTTAWAPTTAYSVGATRILTGANWAYLECIKAGTSGGSLATSLVPYEPDLSREFTTNTQYRYGEVVRGSTDQQPIAANGSNLITSVLFQVTGPAVPATGTSGGTRPTWNTTPGNTTVSGGVTFTAIAATTSWVADGTVVWAAKCHSGVLVRTRCSIEHVYVTNATNAGINVRANGGIANANHTRITDCVLRQCGIGIMTSGQDAQMITGLNNYVESAGYGMPGNGGIGLLDAGFLNSTWIGCQVANDPTLGGGPSFQRTLAGVPSLFLNCYSEGYGDPSSPLIQSVCDTSAIFVAGNHGAGFTSGSTPTIFDSGNVLGCRNLTGINKGGATQLNGYMGQQDGINAVGWSTGAEAFVTGVNYSNALGLAGTGWWIVGPRNNNAKQSWAIPATGAIWPGGTVVDSTVGAFWVTAERAHIGGIGADPPSVGFGTAAPASGYWVKGSIVFNKNVTTGVTEGWRCEATGSPGTWTAMANHP